MRALWMALACAGVMAAADLNGIWIGQIPTRNGEMQDIAFQLTQKGTSLGGKLYGDYQSMPVTTGVVAGDLVTFVVVAQEQAGNQINETRLRFTGRFENGELELTRDREAIKTAGNGGDAQVRGNAQQTFRLKRLI